MLRELDQKMEELEVDAFIVYSPSNFYNPNFYYLTHIPECLGGIYVKVRYNDPIILLAADFERDTFKRMSIVKNIATFDDFDFDDKVKKYGNKEEAILKVIEELFSAIGLTKQLEIKWYDTNFCNLSLIDRLREIGYKIKPIGYGEKNLINELRKTKDEQEIEWIRENGRSVEKILSETIEYIRNSKRAGDVVLYEKTGDALTIGDVKKIINLKCVEKGLYNERGIIVAQGEEAAEPHNMGTDSKPIKLNEPIVIDFYPVSMKNRYWFDTTRTIVIGKASKEVKEAYDIVLEAQQILEDCIKDGVELIESYKKVSEFFESKGVRNNFVHAPGHGIGLQIHESPHFTEKDVFKVGNVITNEPGLYFKGKFGIRIEDVLIVNGNGVENLSKISKELEY
jgi:Xaa-Pro aminopeptidase